MVRLKVKTCLELIPKLNAFQFLMVRLKANKEIFEEWIKNKFQFLMVRLKEKR